MPTDSQTLLLLFPEISLVCMAAVIFVGGTFGNNRRGWSFYALAAYGVAAFALWRSADAWSGGAAAYMPSGPFAVDIMGYSLRWLALATGVVLTLLAARQAPKQLASEFLGGLMLVVVGVMLVCSANELTMVFLGLELVSVPTYMLLFLGRNDRATAEATIKYFFLSILASAFLLYGMSFLYGLTGSTSLPEIRASLAAAHEIPALNVAQQPLLQATLVLLLVGLGFKIAAAPFHFYAPDVYQGATNLTAGLLATAPKIAGIAVLIRLVVAAFPPDDFIWQLFMTLAILSMTIGNVCALWQNNIRRLMAYSSIAHSGYMLIGLAVAAAANSLLAEETSVANLQAANLQAAGIAATLFYLTVYVFASLGVFAACSLLAEKERGFENISDLSGLAKSKPWAAGAIAVFMFSLAGIPPLAGFWGKLSLMTESLNVALPFNGSTLATAFCVLAVVGMLNAAIAAGYYLRVIAVMFFQPPTGHAEPSVHTEPVGGWLTGAAVGLCTVAVLGIGLAPQMAAEQSSRSEDGVRVFVTTHATQPAANLATLEIRGAAEPEVTQQAASK